MITSTIDALGSYWREAGELLGFVVLAPHVVVLPSGQALTLSACLPQFGAQRGMLLTESFEQISSHTEALVNAGYGYSALSPPRDNTVIPAEVIEILQDWGWCSEEAPEPQWLGEI